MSVIDLHPEDLLHKARRETLDDDEALRLRQHFEHCDACAFEHRAAGDFERDGLPQPGDDVLLARIAARVVGDATTGGATAVDFGNAPLAPPRDRQRSMFWLVAAAAALSVVTVGASAAVWMWTGQREEPAEQERPLRARRRPASVPAAPVATPTEQEAAAVPAEIAEEPEPSRGRSRRSEHRRTSTAEPAPAATAADLLARADAARRSNEFVEAVALYRELQRTFPSSREERVSFISAGRILLDRLARPADALAQFTQYVRHHPTGTLAEEARIGRALSLGRLGRANEELSAWRELIQRHPQSPEVPRATRRIAELSTRR